MLPGWITGAGGVTDAETVEVFALIGLNTMSTYVNSITTTLPEPNLRPEISQEEVELAVLGNEDASRRIVEALQRLVISTIYRFLDRGFASEVEDVAQEIFLKVFRDLHRFDPMRGVKLTTWVFAIVKHHCFDLTKKRRIKTTSLQSEDGGINRSMEPRDARRREPPETALRSEVRQQIDKALQELRSEHRLVFVLREYKGLDYKTIAEAAGTKEGTVKSRLHRAKQALRDRLACYLNGDTSRRGSTPPSDS